MANRVKVMITLSSRFIASPILRVCISREVLSHSRNESEDETCHDDVELGVCVKSRRQWARCRVRVQGPTAITMNHTSCRTPALGCTWHQPVFFLARACFVSVYNLLILSVVKNLHFREWVFSSGRPDCCLPHRFSQIRIKMDIQDGRGT